MAGAGSTSRERIDDVDPAIPLGRKFSALDDGERVALDAWFEDPRVSDLVLALNGRGEDAEVRLVDAAYRMKGCSSVGNLRCAGLVPIDDGEASATPWPT